MTSLALGSKLSSINTRTRVAKAVANFLTGLPQKLVRTTRAGLATCIGPDGTLQWGPHNLLAEGCNNLDNTGAAPVTNASLTTTTVALTTANGSYWYKATPATLPVGTVLIFQALASCSVPRTVCFRAANGTTGSANEAKTNVALTQTPQVVWVTLTVTTAAPISWGIDNRSLVGATDTGVTGVISVTNVMCENVTGTNRTTPSEYVDSTVKNRLGYTNDFANAYWTKIAMGVYEKTCTGPSGQPATTLVAGSANAEIYQSLSLAGVYTSGLLIRRRSGTGAVSIRNSANSAWLPLTLTNDWQYFANDSGTSGGLALCDLLIATYTDSIDICDAQLNPGTTLWPYSYNPGAAPAVGPLYGQRTDYDPITLACKGALIEPTQVTQLLANPDDLSASPWTGAVSATNDGTKFRGRRFWKCAKTTTGTSEYRQNTGASFTSGYFTAGLAFMASANCNQIDFGLLGGLSTWGAAGDTMCSIDSGPGTLIQQVGGLWRIAGLSTDVPTIITMTRNILVSETVGVFLYPDTSTSATIGKAVYCQVDNLEAGRSKTSFIPNPATSGTVVRVADTSSVGYDDLAKALPWLMDANAIVSPEGPISSASTNAGVTDATTSIAGFAASIQFSAGATTQICYRPAASTNGQIRSFSCVVQMDDNSAPVVSANSGLGDFSIMQNNTGFGATSVAPRGDGSFLVKLEGYTSNAYGSCGIVRYSTQSGKALRVTAMKDCLGPVAQTYYPQSSKQGTIVFEGDLTYGSTAASIFSLENTAANRVLLYKPTASPTVYGYINGNGVNSNQVITSGVPFKAALGFSLSSAGITANGSSEVAIPPGAFALAPNILRLANDATGNGSGSVRIRRLRIFSTNLPASTKQALTR